MTDRRLIKKLSKDKAIKKLAKRGLFTLSEARKFGISHPTVLRLVKRGTITKVDRGIYAVAGSEPYGDIADFVVACERYGENAVVGGLTALFHYRLIDEVPSQLWLLVPSKIRSIDTKYRLLRTKRDLATGVLKKKGYRITSLERTLIDALIFSSKLGDRLTKLSIVRALRRKLTNTSKLFIMAKKLDALDTLESSWQSILAGVSE